MDYLVKYHDIFQAKDTIKTISVRGLPSRRLNSFKRKYLFLNIISSLLLNKYSIVYSRTGAYDMHPAFF